MSRSLYLAAALLLGGAPIAVHAAPDESDRMNLVIVYGNDRCPASSGDEITVCARKPESERYRIPEALRDHPSPQNEAWTSRVTAYEHVGAAGTQSCSAVGAGGWTGCFNQFVNNAYADKKAGTDVHFSDLLAQERAKRAATVDSDAAATQARVEAAEKDYEAQHKPASDAGK